MSFLERNQGCPDPATKGGCFGPSGEYYTLFRTELRFLLPHVVMATLIGLVFFGVLFLLKKTERITLPLYLIIIVSLSAALVSFVLLAYFFPVGVVY
ncbi:hypothetical protein HYW21_05045 [Candidatus Woesearchaeota archaeon]|nr:hypothetical protein [Candidatus Woesearchaeota archaeon]